MKSKLILAIMMMAFSMGYAQQKKGAKTSATKTVSDKKELNKEYITASGLKYKITEKGNGPRATAGSLVSVHYVGTLTNGTKFDSSRDRGNPYSFKLGTGAVIRGWDEGIAMLNVGDKAILTIPPSLGYGANATGPIPANSVLVFEVELMNVKEPVKPWVMTNTDTITTASGLRYLVVQPSTKENPVKAENGKTVEVHYSGFLTNGKLFDSSVERGQPLSFPLGNGMVIKGWEEGIALMKTGDKLRLIIPPMLGYGPGGYGSMIPPNSTLLFDVELVEVK